LPNLGWQARQTLFVMLAKPGLSLIYLGKQKRGVFTPRFCLLDIGVQRLHFFYSELVVLYCRRLF
jgi:hypothetical protein